MAMLARLGVVLGLDSAEFTKGIEQAQKNLNKVAEQIPKMAAVGAAAFTAMTYKAMEFADQISDTAKANEVATQTILALAEGLAQNGGEAENAGKMMSSFTAKIDDAAQGSKDAQEAFARVGVSLKDLGSKDITQLFDQTISKLASMDDPISRNAAAMTLFGKAAKGVDFKGLAEGTAEARHEFQEYARAVDQAAELHDKLDAKSTKTILIFTRDFLPTLDALFDSLNKQGSAFETMSHIGSETFKGLVYGVRLLVSEVQVAIKAYELFGDSIRSAVKGSFNFGENFDKLKQYYASIREGDKEFAKKIMNPESPTGKSGGSNFAGRTVTPYVDKAAASKSQKEAEAVKVAAQLSVEYEKHSQFTLDQLKRKAELIYLTEKERQVEEAVLAIRDDSRKQIEDIDKKRTEAAIHGQTAMVAEYDKQKQLIAERSKYFEEATRQEILLQQEAQNSFEFGWNMAFKRFNEDAQNYATLGQSYFESMSNSMLRGIDQFVATGKLSFKDFTASVLQDLLRIALRMQAMKLMSTAFSFFGGMFGSAAGSTTNYLTGGATYGGSTLGASYTGGRAFADGGEPPVGVPSLVGERGAELFVPRTAGTIIPNNQLSSVLGSGTTINYNAPYINNMSAIDTQSGVQFLAKNKMTIWGLNQSANRSIPAGR